MLIVVVWAFSHQNATEISRAKAHAVEIAKLLADENAKSQLDVCQRAVTAVTNQLNDDLLKITTSFEAEGRSKPAWAVQLEFIITNRAPPTAACIPKENP
jgi:hypothetical protein